MSDKYGKVIPTGKLLDGERRSILFDATKCIGCRQCVHACKDWNEHARTSVFEISPTNWITIEPPVLDALSPTWARNSCMHCDFPMCAAVCPVEAITKYDEGPVVINHDVCIGCEYCVHACPWGVISQNSVTKKAEKCTMCSDRIAENKQPFCVQACPAEALDFGLEAGMKKKSRDRAKEINGFVYGEAEAGGTQLLYVLAGNKSDYAVRNVGRERYPRHKIPLKLMIKDLFTFRCHPRGKLRALYLAIIHPHRLVYRYWPWRRSE